MFNASRILLIALSLIACKKEEPMNRDASDSMDPAELASQVKGKGAFKAVSALRKRCNADERAACFHLGRAMEAWKETGTERASAEKWYRKACDLQDGKACLEAGRFNMLGKHGAAVDRMRGVKYFEKACGLKEPSGCVYRDYYKGLRGDPKSGPAYLEGLAKACSSGDQLACAFKGRLDALAAKSVTQLESAHSALSAACQKKSLEACTFLGEFLERHRDLNSGGSAFTAQLDRGCRGGIAEGCASLARVYMEQAQDTKYPPKVVGLLVDACMFGELGTCATLSHLYYDGKDLPVSYESALFYARRGCSGGNGVACLLAAHIFKFGQGTKPNFDESLRYLKESCALREWAACLEAGQLFLYSPKPYHNVKAAVELFENGCKNKHLPSCSELGAVYEVKAPAKARKIHEEACEKGALRSCNRLGGMLLADEASLKKQGALARKIFEKTCNLKDGEGCFRLGGLYERGIGVPRSKGMELKLTRQACTFKFQDACGKLAYLDFKKYAGRKGEHAEKARGKAAEIMQNACDNGSYQSCYYLGEAYEKDGNKLLDTYVIAKAEGLYAKACRGQIAEACEGLKRIEQDRTVREKKKDAPPMKKGRK